MTRTLRMTVLTGAVALGALAAGGVAYAVSDAPEEPEYVVVDRSGPGGTSPAQDISGADCPWDGGAPDAGPAETQL
jgi:hypothetical protein